MNKARLMAMMFLEFFIWGAWYVTVGNYMAKIGMSNAIYWAYTVSPIGAIISPFFLGKEKAFFEKIQEIQSEKTNGNY